MFNKYMYFGAYGFNIFSQETLNRSAFLTFTLVLESAQPVLSHSVTPVEHVEEPSPPVSSPAIPSVVFRCSSSYVQHMTSQVNTTNVGTTPASIARTVMSFIDGLCSGDEYVPYGDVFVECLQTSLPYSSYPIDKILLSALDLSSLPDILSGGCNSTAELNASLECIINSVMSNPVSILCLTDVGSFFTNVISDGAINVQTNTYNFCRTWGTMVTCISPHMALCSEELTAKWNQYGAQILSSSCRKQAFVKEVSTPEIENTPAGILDFFNANSSAVMSCAQEYSQNMIQFMPTSIFNHSVHPGDTVVAFNNVCGEKIQSFMFCMDERRLNATSAIDDFMFRIISTVNMRVAYNKMCSQLEVLKKNINCLLNSAMELKTCMCFMNDLLQKIVQLSLQPQGYTYEQIVEPFCGFYVSFAECYVSMLGMCNRDLGLLMQEVYLGALTPTCLQAKGGTCIPKPSSAAAAANISKVIQCGVPVSTFVANMTRNRNVSQDLDEMMQSMTGLVVTTYEYTCSIGGDLLDCIRDQINMSQNPLDRLLLMMFNITKLDTVLQEGCQLSLIQDVKSRLKFMLSTLLSDYRTEACIDALYEFRKVVAGRVNMNIKDIDLSYCRIWADFSECIESKISCSSPQLATKWRQFTIDSLTDRCKTEALSVQMTNQYGSVCDVHQMHDSVVSICGMPYMEAYYTRSKLRNNTNNKLDVVILGEIDHFCQRDMENAVEVINCLAVTVPKSYLKMDRVVNHVFNISILKDIASEACAFKPELEKHMLCMVDTIQHDNASHGCVDHLVSGFNITSMQPPKFQKLAEKGCRKWNDFVNCIDPYIASCDGPSSVLWKKLSSKILSVSCKTTLSSPDTGPETSEDGIQNNTDESQTPETPSDKTVETTPADERGKAPEKKSIKRRNGCNGLFSSSVEILALTCLTICLMIRKWD